VFAARLSACSEAPASGAAYVLGQLLSCVWLGATD
jgi:hypothetical protein